MYPLVMLYKLQGRALVRRMTRNMRSVKGALLGLFGIIVIALWLGPSIWQAHAVPRTDPQIVRDTAPLVLLTMIFVALVSSGGEKAVAFTPAEVDFLFPGPFTRRQLLAYKIGKALAGLFFSSTLMAMVFLRHSTGWMQAWSGMFLALLFMHLLSMAVTLIAQSTGERIYTRSRKIALVLIVLAVAMAARPIVTSHAWPGFLAFARMLNESRIGAVLLKPLQVFGDLFTASSLAQGLIYAAFCLLVNAVLLFIVFYLDADYLEAAAAKSQAVYARLQRLRKGGLTAIGAPSRKARGSVPQLPYLAGTGPIAWRQMTSAIRSSKGLLIVMVILAIAIGPILFTSSTSKDPSGSVVGIMAWMTLFVGGWLRFDFRGDLDQIDHLKSLPVAGWAIAAGQIVTPTLLMTACHLGILASVMTVSRRADLLLVSAAALSLPFNWMLFGIENFIFLLFPTRAAANPADFQGYGRQILVFFVKGVLMLVTAGIAAATGFLVHLLSNSWPATIASAGVVLAIAAAATVPAVAWAFGRFDVAGDVPA